MRLMIVDDHAGTREMIRNFLNLPGITFCECASGDEAVLRAREFKPNWVTIDVQMPGLNGFQSAEALRAEHPSARVIIVTGFNEPHFYQFSQSVGAVGLIHKENLMELRTILVNAMTHSNQFPSVSDRPSPTSS
ncbi:MAG: response regulator transcription factor [Verrucomicrobiota bacterium]